MSLFTDTITIYNKHTNAGSFTGGLPPVDIITWSRCVIKNTMWKDKIHYSAGDGKNFINKTVSITIPLNEMEADKQFVKPAEFNDPEKTWTLQIDDIIVYGECDKEITDQYTTTKLKKEFKSCVVSQIADSSEQNILPKWKVEAV